MNTPLSLTHKLLFAVLATILPASMEARAQAIAPAVAGEPHSLFISILDGEGALNDIRQRTAREPIVEVQDENHKPVAGALVLFTIDNPASGAPYATFSGTSSLTVTTDAAGRAVGSGFQVGRHRGQFNVRVRATKGQLEAAATIAETNLLTLVDGHGAEAPVHVGLFAHKKLDWLLGTAAAGGVAAGLIIALRGSSQTTITTGTGTVGAPAAVPGIRISFGGHGH